MRTHAIMKKTTQPGGFDCVTFEKQNFSAYTLCFAQNRFRLRSQDKSLLQP
jgi:hypothetical protein